MLKKLKENYKRANKKQKIFLASLFIIYNIASIGYKLGLSYLGYNIITSNQPASLIITPVTYKNYTPEYNNRINVIERISRPANYTTLESSVAYYR